MEIVIIIIAVIMAVAAFFLGRSQVKPIEDNNNKIRKDNQELTEQKNQLEKDIIELTQLKEYGKKERQRELDKLDSDLSWKWKDIHNAEDKLKRIEDQYQDKLQVIKNTEQLAKDAYDKNMEIYARKMLDKETEFQNTVEKKQKEIDVINEELESLKATKAAAIEAARKEQEITDNKDAYCLILPREEERDISLLREVQDKVSKPRAVAMCIWSNYYLPIAKEKLPKILGGNDIVGIYKLTNQKTGECYIGQAKDCKKRIYEQMRAGLGIDTPQGNQLYQAMQKYGIDDFSIELLLKCKPEELNDKEKYFIELYQSQTYGYNISSGIKSGQK